MAKKYRVRQQRFNTGIVSPGIGGRLDLSKRDGALHAADNAFLDYTGGIKKRAGMKHRGVIPAAPVASGAPYRDAPRFFQWQGVEGQQDLIVCFFRRGWDYDARERIEPGSDNDRAYVMFFSADGRRVLRRRWRFYGCRSFNTSSGVSMALELRQVGSTQEEMQLLDSENSSNPYTDNNPNPYGGLTDEHPFVPGAVFATLDTYSRWDADKGEVVEAPQQNAWNGTNVLQYLVDNWDPVRLQQANLNGRPTDSDVRFWNSLQPGNTFVSSIVLQPAISGLTQQYLIVQEWNSLIEEGALISGDDDSLSRLQSDRFFPTAEAPYVLNRLLLNIAAENLGLTPDPKWEIGEVLVLKSPYHWDEVWHSDADDKAGLQVEQSRDVMTIVHPHHPPQSLIRERRTGEPLEDFRFEDKEFGPKVKPPRNLSWDGVRLSRDRDPSQEVAYSPRSYSGGFGPANSETVEIAVTASSEEFGESFLSHADSDDRICHDPDFIAGTLVVANDNTTVVNVYGFDIVGGYSGLLCRVSEYGDIRQGDWVVFQGGQGTRRINGRRYMVKALIGAQPSTNDTNIVVHPAARSPLAAGGNEEYKGPWIVLTPEPAEEDYIGVRQEETAHTSNQDQIRDGASGHTAYAPGEVGDTSTPGSWSPYTSD